MSKVFWYVLLAVAVVIAAAALGMQYFLDMPSPRLARVVKTFDERPSGQTGRPNIGGAFALVDHNGKPVTDADFRGRHLLVFFGYTYCPDVCPTNLTMITEALNLLGEDAKLVQPLFITVDPKRDTPEQMKMYVGHFHPSLVGLTGSIEQTRAVAKAYGVAAEIVVQVDDHEDDDDDGDDAKEGEAPDDDDGHAHADADDYLVGHTAITFLMGPDGVFETFFRNGTSPATIAAKIKEFL